MSARIEKRSQLARYGSWLAELILVFIGVYAAFWLNNYQQHRQDAARRDRILATLEQTLREGVESGKISGEGKKRTRLNFGGRSTWARCRRCVPLFS